MERAPARGIIGGVEDDVSVEDELRALGRHLLSANERNEQMIAELASVIDTLLQVLAQKGELNDGHLRVIQKLKKHAKTIPVPPIALDRTNDKYSEEIPCAPIDCEARMHLCHGRCCGFESRLSAQDLREGKLEWEIDRPYYLARDRTGYCVYQNKESGLCGNYEYRPAACRRYDCREDRRVWIDFEKMIPAPMPAELVTIRRTKT